MLADLVVDTNVFVHANNHEHPLSADADALARKLLDPAVTTALRVDPGFHPVEGQNRSRIASEYFCQLVPGMLGHHFIQVLAANQRIKEVELKTDRSRRDRVRGLVSDKSDRIFLLVSLDSDDKVLASHDDRAFPDEVRRECHTRWSVDVCKAPDALARL